jgi:hypothetical protein
MDDSRVRPGIWIAVGGGLALIGLVVWLLESGQNAPSAPPPRADQAAAATGGERPANASRREERPASPSAAPVAEEVPYIEGLVYGEIDLREAKALMPDNIYWQRGAPTKDPAELERREAERKRRNEEYGRVIAGDASEDEVRKYYDDKRRVSQDYLEFSEFMARRYRNSDNKEFVGMLELAMKMHAEKLAQLDEELERSLEHARQREKARQDWARQKEEFGDIPRTPTLDEQLNE